MAHSLGVANLRLHHADLLDWKPDGEFDYIVAHGVYSWVPPEVRHRILDICAEALAPNGIAFISYNALPGTHLRRYAWDLMKLHTRGLANPADRIAAARSMARTVFDCSQDGLHWPVLRDEMKSVLERSPHGLFHDDLASINEALYLTDFVVQSERHGLQYLGDAQPQRDDVRGLPCQIEDWLGARQYGDFFAARRFRESLLVRSEIRIDRDPKYEYLADLFVASRVIPGDPQPDGTQKFELSPTRTVTTNFVPARELLCRLAEIWPGSVPVRTLLGPNPEPDKVETVFRLFSGEAIELRTAPPLIAGTVSRRPCASRLARAQIQAEMNQITTQRHQTVDLGDDTTRRLLLLLDGSRECPELIDELERLGVPRTDAAAQIATALDRLHRINLFVS
jgi:SAM-dependent methyltransferase